MILIGFILVNPRLVAVTRRIECMSGRFLMYNLGEMFNW
jgi:hypothetical protein